jgi:hypothetical protein
MSRNPSRPVPRELAFIDRPLVEFPFGKHRIRKGVYFLICVNKVMYVGKTQNGARRAMDHLYHFPFNRVLFLPLNLPDIGSITINCIEYAFIRRIRPYYNKQPIRPHDMPYDLDLDAYFGGRAKEEEERIRNMNEEAYRQYMDKHPTKESLDRKREEMKAAGIGVY